jgi:hypothetical protein
MDLGEVLVSKHIRAGKKPYNSRILEARFLVTGHKEPGLLGMQERRKPCEVLP